ncbi:hypothetical protein [Streptomyces sp. NPDC086010]|uniref:hypothetical protein n=1 Tax=Streptomyces sp. NPDC086010 TaxID=3365745 RepID=UPI0037D2A9F5
MAQKVKLAGAENGAGAATDAKISSIVAGMAAGADSIDDLRVLRHGAMPTLFGVPDRSAVAFPRTRIAAARASVTRSARLWSAIAQPARRREARSMTVARQQNFPSSTVR